MEKHWLRRWFSMNPYPLQIKSNSEFTYLKEKVDSHPGQQERYDTGFALLTGEK
ncbi:hypothetical protein [Pedobacter cryoconitis]|uniref:hypothetical protein n=1 Tax=Pedobacter cryoconitis TaxID=188932 RepID=UPI001474A168|nr:hypothetical protein [Pedobacter cryoconitis]